MRANESLPLGWVCVHQAFHQDAWRIAPWWYGIPWKGLHWLVMSVWFPYFVKAWPDAYERRLRETHDTAYTDGFHQGMLRVRECIEREAVRRKQNEQKPPLGLPYGQECQGVDGGSPCNAENS